MNGHDMMLLGVRAEGLSLDLSQGPGTANAVPLPLTPVLSLLRGWEPLLQTVHIQ